MEKQLATAAYWIGIASTAIALITRALAVLHVFVLPHNTTVPGGTSALSYRSFLEGAILFFVMAIASAVIALAKERKA